MTLGSHQTPVGKSQVWITPRYIVDALGPFDLDPCAADPRPWDCAAVNYPEASDGLSFTWAGRVWCNPPFDRRVVGVWADRMVAHGNGILLLHARTETDWFARVWNGAHSILFLGQRLSFCDAAGAPAPHNSGAPVVLAAFGEANTEHLRWSGLTGHLAVKWERQ